MIPGYGRRAGWIAAALLVAAGPLFSQTEPPRTWGLYVVPLVGDVLPISGTLRGLQLEVLPSRGLGAGVSLVRWQPSAVVVCTLAGPCFEASTAVSGGAAGPLLTRGRVQVYGGGELGHLWRWDARSGDPYHSFTAGGRVGTDIRIASVVAARLELRPHYLIDLPDGLSSLHVKGILGLRLRTYSW